MPVEPENVSCAIAPKRSRPTGDYDLFFNHLDIELAPGNLMITAGADAISLINTLKGMAIDIVRRQPLLGHKTGGLSGPAIKPVALYMVYEVAGAVEVPVVGCGGIATDGDAIEFIMAGATAIQVGTANLTDPRAPFDVTQGIEQFMEKEGIEDIRQLIGIARR